MLRRQGGELVENVGDDDDGGDDGVGLDDGDDNDDDKFATAGSYKPDQGNLEKATYSCVERVRDCVRAGVSVHLLAGWLLLGSDFKQLTYTLKRLFEARAVCYRGDASEHD